MVVLIPKNFSLSSFFVGCGIFIFSALALVVPSGYSYGALLLLICSISLIKRSDRPLERFDWLFLSVLFVYFIIHLALIILFSLPSRNYDGLMRFLLVIPVYALLIKIPPKPLSLWLGLAVGVVGAGVLAVFQKLSHPNDWLRSEGHLNAIQFGDISLLMASFVICGAVWAFYILNKKWMATLFLFTSVFGFLASFLSLSRGGWIAIPVVAYIIYQAVHPRTKKRFLLASVLGFIAVLLSVSVLPESNFIKQRVQQTRVEVSEIFDGQGAPENTSFGARVQMWEIGVNAFAMRPLLGWGDITAIKNQFPAQWKSLDAIDDFNHLHNDYLDELAKKGIVGFVALMMLYLFPLVYFLKLKRKNNKQLNVFAASGVILIVCIMIFGLTQTFMAHISGVTVFTFYLVIIMAYCRNFERLLNTNKPQAN